MHNFTIKGRFGGPNVKRGVGFSQTLQNSSVLPGEGKEKAADLQSGRGIQVEGRKKLLCLVGLLRPRGKSGAFRG